MGVKPKQEKRKLRIVWIDMKAREFPIQLSFNQVENVCFLEKGLIWSVMKKW